MNYLAKRIIPCLDIKGSKVVKGVNFVNLQDAGDPVDVAKRYNDQGADEIVFLDILATHENKKLMVDIIKNVSKEVFIPLTVGGGISSLDDIYNLLDCGCDKVSINSFAIKNRNFIKESSKVFGSQFIVLAVDVKRNNGTWSVYANGGRINTKIDAIEWIRVAQDMGAGEILLTSMDADGTKDGYDLDLLKEVSGFLDIPLIASGGAGSPKHLKEAFLNGADAALAASIFHYKEIGIMDLKGYLREEGILVRE